jgi:SAM-dependent methyltransferase
MTDPTSHPEPHRDHLGRAHQPDFERIGRDHTEWDKRYAEVEQVWSGEPNGALVAEVSDLERGTALDVGCGEGADAIWLAGLGWRVTAIDVSDVALQRAGSAAEQSHVDVDWIHAGLLEAILPSSGFDLVSAQYPALLHTPDRDAERRLIDSVAPLGHLLVVHHADVDVEEAKAHGFDPADYVAPSDVALLLDESWQITFDERRPRQVHSGAGSGHSHDVVLHAHHDVVLHAHRLS